MHLILSRFKGYARNHAGSLDTFRRAAFAVAGNESVFKDTVERVLNACEALCGIIVLVMDMDVTMAHGMQGLLAQQVIVYIRFCGLRCELHHHARGRVGVHVRILAGDFVIFCLDDLDEQVACLGAAGT